VRTLSPPCATPNDNVLKRSNLFVLIRPFVFETKVFVIFFQQTKKMFSLKCRALITNNSTLRFNKVILTKNINCFLSRNLRRSIFGFKRHAFFSLFFVEAQTVALKVVGVNRENTICFFFEKHKPCIFFWNLLGEVCLLSLICGQSQKCPFSKTDSLETLFFLRKICFFFEKNKNFFCP